MAFLPLMKRVQYIVMHARVKADLFADNPDNRIDNQLLKLRNQQEQIDKEVLRLIVLAVEVLAKRGLPFRGNNDDKDDFSSISRNRGNFVALLQLLGKFSNKMHIIQAKLYKIT